MNLSNIYLNSLDLNDIDSEETFEKFNSNSRTVTSSEREANKKARTMALKAARHAKAIALVE